MVRKLISLPPSAWLLHWTCLQVASALIPLSQALYANGDLGPARESCTRALKILQVAFGPSPRVEVSKEHNIFSFSFLFFLQAHPRPTSSGPSLS